MKFTLNWLKQYIDTDMPAVAIADRLTMLGLEVDSVTPLYQGLTGVKIARVMAVNPHPNADKLTLCDVQVGTEIKRVVCGAPNVRAGMITAIALPGAELPNGMAIRKTKIRGEASEGMLCSAKELGIAEDQSGIMDLPADIESGVEIASALGLSDVAIEVDLTPNRPDCASVLGIAREVAAFVGGQVNRPVVQSSLPKLTGKGLPFSVDVEATDACPRYAARLLTNVKIGPSPWWLQRILLAVGQRPINNVVDVTNFVMLEYGQPLHAFDFKKLAGGRIIVRKARPDETITTLDGMKREPETETLLICDAEKAVALAGVMGGANTEVSDDTTEILLESAYFDPLFIRRAARQTNLSSESSYRFERGIDPLGVPFALERAAKLIVEIAGATLMPDGVDHYTALHEPAVITLRAGRTSDLLGLPLTIDHISSVLAGIEIESTKVDADRLAVTVPSFRVDLEREVDLIEEVARLTGYNEIPTSLPIVPMSFPDTDNQRQLRKEITDCMIALGFYEAINYSFVSEKHFDMLGLPETDDRRATVRLLNPLAEEQSVLRTMLLPGMLENLRRNVSHQTSDVRLFEVGKVFYPVAGSQPNEREFLTAIMSGRRYPNSPHLYFGADSVDFYDVRGVAESICNSLRRNQVTYRPATRVNTPYGEHGACVEIYADEQVVGSLGKINASVCKEFGIKQDAFYIEMDLTALGQVQVAPKKFQSLPRFPFVQWDLAILVPEEVGAGDMVGAIQDVEEKLIEHVEIFDVYRGKNIEPGWKSVAMSVTYRSADKTLDDAMVGKVHNKIIQRVLSRFGGKLREA